MGDLPLPLPCLIAGGYLRIIEKVWTLGRKENRQTHHVPETVCWCCHFSTRWLSIPFSLDFGHFQTRSPPQPLNPPSSQPIPYPWGFAIGQGCGGRRRAELGSGVDAAALPVFCWEGPAVALELGNFTMKTRELKQPIKNMDETNEDWQGLPGGLWFFVIYDQQYVTGRYDQQLYYIGMSLFLVAGFLKLARLEYAKWI